MFAIRDLLVQLGRSGTKSSCVKRVDPSQAILREMAPFFRELSSSLGRHVLLRLATSEPPLRQRSVHGCDPADSDVRLLR